MSLTLGLILVLESQIEGSPPIARQVNAIPSAFWTEAELHTSLLLPSGAPYQRGKDRRDRRGTNFRSCVLWRPAHRYFVRSCAVVSMMR